MHSVEKTIFINEWHCQFVNLARSTIHFARFSEGQVISGIQITEFYNEKIIHVHTIYLSVYLSIYVSI